MSAAWKKENPERAAEYARQYNLAHRKESIARLKAWNAAHPESGKARALRYSHTEHGREKQKAYRLANKEKIAARIKKWRLANPDRLKHSKKKYLNTENGRRMTVAYRKQRDPFEQILRCRVAAAVKAKGVKKLAKTFELIGCTPQALRLWLEAKFQPGMGWHNRGEWHIDHVRPCASFDLKDLRQQRQCFHYSNLQPLWATENIRKGASYG